MIETMQIIVPFMDFIVRYSMFPKKALEEFKTYLASPNTGFELEELKIIQEFLQALDQHYDAKND